MPPFQQMGKCHNLVVKAGIEINQKKAEGTDGSHCMQSKKFAYSTVLEGSKHILDGTESQRRRTWAVRSTSIPAWLFCSGGSGILIIEST